MNNKDISRNVRESPEESVLDKTAKDTTEQDVQPSESATCSHSANNQGKKIQNNSIERDPLFVVVDSSCASNHSSKEILINSDKYGFKDAELPKYLKKYVLPIDVPCTSKDVMDPFRSTFNGRESKEELQMLSINLQSDNDLPVNHEDFDDKEESIVISYLKNKKKSEEDSQILCSKKKSSLFNDVSRMETIPEKISEHSLDIHIPSYPGSPRSLDLNQNESDSEDYYHNNPRLKEAIEFLHADKELLIAAEIGNDHQIEIILRRKDTHIQQMDHLGRNALHLAVCSDNLRAIELLLKAGVDPNVKDSVGMTPLSLCLMRRPSLTVAKLLFDYGAKLMPRSNIMDTGLFIQFVMMSIPTEEEENIMELLIQKGAKINDPDAPGGRQALHFAAMSNNCPLIRILVRLGADLELKNHRNETPREMAATFDCVEAYELLTEIEENNDDPGPSSGPSTFYLGRKSVF